jgi:NAD(P)-dependent dehydrogenase (short-subunit alcohol dehydrogenase family)
MDEAQDAGGRLAVLLCDVTQLEQVQALAATVTAATPRLDGLVNNAGAAFPAPLELLPLDVLRAQLELNVVAHLAVTQVLMPLLKAARGTIINVSSQKKVAARVETLSVA